MPTAPPPSRDVALETRFFLERFKKPIIWAAIVVLLAGIAFTGYRFYSDRRAAAASAALASANSAQEYEQVIARYPNTPAGADASAGFSLPRAGNSTALPGNIQISQTIN